MKKSFCGIAAIALAAAAGGCAELALEPDQIPHSIEVEPQGARVKVGDAGQFTVTVFDADGQAIPGPPPWAPPRWEILGSAMVEVGSDGSYTATGHGEARIGAELAGLLGRTELLISPTRVRLSAPVVYLNQAAQNLEGSVPLIAGRDALLRVFVTGDEVSYYEPGAYADFFQDGELVHTAVMGPPYKIPDSVNERWLYQSFNDVIPGAVVQPGVEMVVHLDPEGVVPLSPGSQSRFPATGTQALDVVALPTHRQTIVPSVVAPNRDEAIASWARGMTAEHRDLRFGRTVLPVGEMEVTVHETYRTSADLTTEDGWGQFIREIALMWFAEGERGYYYGAAMLPRASVWGGLGYVGFPVSVGANSSGIFAHELGHNLNLLHAPCGGAGGPDRLFPYKDGSTGVWGYDPASGALVDPRDYKDLMGYCNPDWVSDYSFVKAMRHRLDTETGAGVGAGAGAAGSADGAPRESVLLLWGSAGNGELLLEPAFLMDAPARLPDSGGPYRLEGIGPGGLTVFSFDFAPTPLEFGGGHFLFAVPFDAGHDGVLERVVLAGPEGEFALGRSSTRPMAILSNRDNGQVRAILRDWSDGFALAEGNTAIMVSDGLPDGVR